MNGRNPTLDKRPLLTVLVCEDFQSVFRHYEGVLPLCGREFVLRHYRPFVLFVHKHFVGAHVYHRFDGEHHARHEQHPCAFSAEVFHIGVFVKRQSHAVSAKVAHDGESILVCMALDGIAYVAHKSEGLGCLPCLS